MVWSACRSPRRPPPGVVRIYSPASTPSSAGDIVKRIAFLFVLILVPILFTEMSSRASAQSAPGAVPSNPPSVASPSSGTSSAQNKPETRITAYTLPVHPKNQGNLILGLQCGSRIAPAREPRDTVPFTVGSNDRICPRENAAAPRSGIRDRP
jgi:hypothetical protein